MRKIITLITALATAFSVSVLPVRAISEPECNDDYTTHYSKTRYLADINDDGKLNVSDLVSLSIYLHDDDEKWLNFIYDINMDGNIDVFDMILMRKTIISPEKAFKQTLNCDVLKNVDKTNNVGTFVSSTDELNVYLSELGTDEDEIKQYLDIYDSTFFETNDLVLAVMEQSNGAGIHHIPETSGFLSLYPFVEYEMVDPEKMEEFFRIIGRDISEYRSLNIFFVLSDKRYRVPPMIYPEKKSILLFQCNVPKNAREVSDDIAVATDFDILGTGYYSYKYENFDKKKHIEVYVADYGFLDPDYSYYIYYFDENGKRYFVGGEESVELVPFCNEGEWRMDDNGNHIFSGGDSYGKFFIKWTENYVEIIYTYKEYGYDYITKSVKKVY